MDGRERRDVRPGLTVEIVLKQDQHTGRLTRGELVSTFEPQRVQFARTVTARHLRLTAVSGFGPDPSAALAEVAVVYAGRN